MGSHRSHVLICDLKARPAAGTVRSLQRNPGSRPRAATQPLTVPRRCRAVEVPTLPELFEPVDEKKAKPDPYTTYALGEEGPF